MTIKSFEDFDLFLSETPCEIFDYFGMEEIHGLNRKDCLDYKNNKEDSYIAGWCNYRPGSERPFVFINLSRCTEDIKTMGLIFHEMMHLSGIVFNGDWKNKEEEMIEFAEIQAYKVFEIVEKSIKI